MPPLGRREMLKLTGATVVSSTTVSRGRASDTAQQSVDWPQFQSNSKNTGHLPDGTAPVTGVSKRWQFSTFGDLDILNAPVITGETIFLAARDLTFYAINANTGNKRWQYDIGAELLVTPAVGNGRVYLPTNAGLKALSVESGKVQWSVDYPQKGVEGHVTYAAGMVIPPIGPLTVLNASDGSEQWQKDIHPGFGVAVNDGTVYVGESDTNRVYAFGLEAGTRQWRQGIAGRIEPVVSPVVRNNRLYLITQDQTLFALDAASGSTQWTYSIGGKKSRSTPAVTDDTVYVGEAPADDDNPPIRQGAVHAVNAETGKRRWRTETPGAVVDSPTVVNSVVYVGSRGEDNANRLHALDAQSGEPHWGLQTRENVHAHAIADGFLYATTGDGYLTAYEEGDTTTTATDTPTEKQSTAASMTMKSTDVTETERVSAGGTDGGDQTVTGHQRERGFFTNKGDGPEFLSNVFNLTVLGFLLSVAGIIHQMLQGR